MTALEENLPGDDEIYVMNSNGAFQGWGPGHVVPYQAFADEFAR